MSRFLRILTILIASLNAGISVAGQTTSEQWLPEINMPGYQNKVVYLDFWASWCIPCRLSFPWLNEMQAKYRDQGLVIIAVNLDRDVNNARQFVKRYPADFLLYSDPKGLLAQQYRITAMPSSYLFSGEGQLIDKHLGFKKSEVANYEANIVKLLEQLTTKKAAGE
ncbi:TlpA disulfide reductase family protein [Psychromonas sp.]|uniref:TlpA disulfide reductase family protein n=1 Tax=Psychromonas sp. TaxID=1884585 RepID=UPI00356A54E3